VLLGIVRLFLLRVPILVEVGDATNRRRGGRGNLDQVKAARLGNLDSVAQRQDSDLRAVGVDYTDFLSANQVINPNRGLSRGWGSEISSDKAPPPAWWPDEFLSRYRLLF
jgi:hypothetical protein